MGGIYLVAGGVGRPVVERVELEGKKLIGRFGSQVGSFGSSCKDDCFDL